MVSNSLESNHFSHMSAEEKAQMSQLVDYSSIQSLPEIWPRIGQKFGHIIALQDPHSNPEVSITYSKLTEMIQQFAAGLQASGLKTGVRGNKIPPRVALFADNSPRWIIADQGIMTAEAVNVVRGATADREELLFILADSGSTGLVVENLALLNKLRPELDALPIQLVVLMSDEQPAEYEKFKVVNFNQLMSSATGMTLPMLSQNRETLATLMYTSGTTGKPKGVMLTHGNLLHQITTLGAVIKPDPGDRLLSILPTWHAYERCGEYFILSQGCTQIYTNLRSFKRDLKEFKPNFMVSVPRLWESIYEGVQKQLREQSDSQQKLVQFFLSSSQKYIENKRIWQGLHLQTQPVSLPQRLLAGILTAVFWPIHFGGEKLAYQKIRAATGGQFNYAISGGGSLAMYLEDFFEIIGIKVLVGYGLTETSPVLSARRPWHNLRGSSGKPLPATEIKIVDPQTRQTLPNGMVGLVLARGPQIMKGYYQNPTATEKVIDSQGWFDTGDLGWLTPEQDLVLTGRAKDTIVLTNGENIEPQPIEDACLQSPYIDQLMLVGQDQRSLGALIVPNLSALNKWALTNNLRLQLPESTPTNLIGETVGADLPALELDSKLIQDLFRQELNREVQKRPGYRIDERIGPFQLILEPFSIENGMMTQTLKIKRNVVMEHYRDMINRMFT